MASSSLTQMRRYHVFPSFHGPDVRRSFLSHLHKDFTSKGITMFKDQEMERGHSIRPELVQAIRESRISIVVLSENYASSSWCLGELVEILKCRKHQGQIVMTIFYKVDPSDVRKQTGDFGSTFQKTCKGKTKEEKESWSRALSHVACIAGYHSYHWANEAEMIEDIVADVSDKLNVALSRDFDGMVGLEAHLTNMDSLLRLECDEVKMIGIWGPAGIGKTTIARALFNKLSNRFQFKCFMGNLKGSRKSVGVDDYDSKLYLQNQLLSKILNQRDLRINHLGAIKHWLQEQRVIIILDDVDDLEQLEVLAKDTSWFGNGTRIIVTTKDKKILKAHGINDVYHVDLPSEEEALEILCLSAFGQNSPRSGFEDLATKVANLCGNLPLGLCVVGSSLRWESKHEWEAQLSSIETNLDRKIEDVLRVGYDRLSKKYQSLFIHVACFFNNETVDYTISMLDKKSMDVSSGLRTLADKSLVRISSNERVLMHNLLQQLGRQIVLEQSDEPGKRQFLVEAEEIRDVLENETGTGSIIGISFDMSKIDDEFSISKQAFGGMRNLKYLRLYNGNVGLLDDMEYLPSLRLLHWDSYPGKSLPPSLHLEHLIELHMPMSNLEQLWGGIQPLPNLKKIDLGHSYKLKEIPNLSKATKLETLTLIRCNSLLEIPSSISNLHKLKKLTASWCDKLQVIATNINLASLEEVDMNDCSLLTSLPDFSSNIKTLNVRNTKIEDVPLSVIGRWRCLDLLFIGSRSLKRLTHVPESVRKLDLRGSDIKVIPDCVIGLPHLLDLIVENCTKLVSIPSLPHSLESLNANHCLSLKRVCSSFHSQIKVLTFYNCLKLNDEARRGIIQQRVDQYVCLPGKELPAEFIHKSAGNSITIPLPPVASSRFKACFLLSPIEEYRVLTVTCRLRIRGVQTNKIYNLARLSSDMSPQSLSEHLFIFGGDLFDEQNICHQVDVGRSEIVFEFSCWYNDAKIIACGVRLLTEEAESNSSEEEEYFDAAESSSSRTKVNSFENVGNRNLNGEEAVETCQQIWSEEEDRVTTIILGVVIVMCMFLIIQIFRETGTYI